MLLDNPESLKEIIRVIKLIGSRSLTAILELHSSEGEDILNLYQALIAWYMENEKDQTIDIPLSAREYEKVKKLYNGGGDPSEQTTEATKKYLGTLIDKNEDKFYLAIRNAIIKGNDEPETCSLNQVFVIKLTSKYKSVGPQTFCVIFKKNENNEENNDLILVDDGTYYNYNFNRFVNDFFGRADESLFNQIRSVVTDKRIKHYDAQIELDKLCESVQVQIDEDFNMVYGAVMFCDFLGWKGLWRGDDNKALRKADRLVSEINDKFIDLTNRYLPLNRYFQISNLISISDTIALMLPMVHAIDITKLFELFGRTGRYILESSITVFPLRGAFTIGYFNYTNNIMIGPAIDEAASWHEQADWIGIMLTPTAQFEYETIEASRKSDAIVGYGAIPLKTNKGSLKYCINWNEPRDAIISSVRRSKSLPPEISNKYINTFNFLAEIKKEGK